MSAEQMILRAEDMKFMSWKAKALEYLRAHDINTDDLSNKGDIIAALQLQAEQEQPDEPAAPQAPEGAVEVNLKKRYCPIWIMNEDGSWERQGEQTVTIDAGLVFLRSDEAQRVLERGQAEATPNTFAGLKG